jgi:hypothetical protein
VPIRNVGDAMRELKAGGSKHIQSRKQAIAVGLKAQRTGKPIGKPTSMKGR